jgi:hypothetical protein
MLGPLPITAAAIALSTWARPEASPGVIANQVVAAEGPPELHSVATSEIKARIQSHPNVECKKSADKLRPQLGPECAVLVREPFVLAGDMGEEELDAWHRSTIAPAARALAHCYFRRPPSKPVTVLLFSGEASYDRYARKLFGETGVSVYGYYKPDRRTLVMNISTGGGTLIHELTHALIDFDFPNVPDWFNEGLASLHEQCRFKPNDSGLEGLPNWRLPGLQKAITEGKLRPLVAIMRDDDFRGADIGRNYAQARYFCLYLQEKGLLEEFYRRLRAGCEHDPHGVEAAESLFKPEKWQTIDRDFQAWVMTLSY